MRIDAGRSICLALMLAVMHAGVATAEPQIVWQVENPFRFFLDPADTQVHRATWLSLSESERNHPVQSAERALSERHPDGWSAFTFTKTCWDGTRNRYACRERADYINPKSHTILARLEGLEDAQTVDCSWLTLAARAGSRATQEGGDAALRHAGAAQRAIPQPAPGSAWRSAAAKWRRRPPPSPTFSSSAWATASPPARVTPTCPCASRRSAPPTTASRPNDAPLTGYPARIGDWQDIGDKKFIEENARWQDQACHRSLYSHQLRAALQLAIEDPHRAVTFAGFACSGADTTFGLFLEYKGNEWVPNPPDLPQISAVAEAQCGDKECTSPTVCRRAITSMIGSPSSRAAWRSGSVTRAVRARSICCWYRLAATTWASLGWWPTPCWTTSRSCAV